MELDRHVEIGLAAHARGYLDARGLAGAMAALGAEPGAPVDAWVGAGRLTRPQLDLVLAQLATPARPRRVTRPRAAPDRYTRVSLLGAGGMGEVHDVLDTVLGRRIAAKTLHPQLVNRRCRRAPPRARGARDRLAAAPEHHPGLRRGESQRPRPVLHDAPRRAAVARGGARSPARGRRGRARPSTASRACCATSCRSARRSTTRTAAASCTAI